VPNLAPNPCPRGIAESRSSCLARRCVPRLDDGVDAERSFDADADLQALPRAPPARGVRGTRLSALARATGGAPGLVQTFEPATPLPLPLPLPLPPALRPLALAGAWAPRPAGLRALVFNCSCCLFRMAGEMYTRGRAAAVLAFRRTSELAPQRTSCNPAPSCAGCDDIAAVADTAGAAAVLEAFAGAEAALAASAALRATALARARRACRSRSLASASRCCISRVAASSSCLRCSGASAAVCGALGTRVELCCCDVHTAAGAFDERADGVVKVAVALAAAPSALDG